MEYHNLDKDFKIIAEYILNQNNSIEEWNELESDDMFQEGSYVGGFDSIEEEFCFSLYTEDHKEYWFQLSIEEIKDFILGKMKKVKVREAE